VYNVAPPEGVAAEFAAGILTKALVVIDARLRSGGDYGVTAESRDNSSIAGVKVVNLKLWGVPAAASHDPERHCGGTKSCSADEPVAKPFLRNPTSCDGPLTATLSADSWQNPGEFSEASSEMPAITGCENVEFSPSLSLQPTTSQADAPTGLHVALHLPQSQPAEKPSESDLRNTSVTLPAGLVPNPASANGLAACSPTQVGLTSAPGVTPVTFTPAKAECPDAAKVGTVEVDTPLLDHPLNGAVYLATPYANPFNSLLAIYIAVFDPQTGVVVKLAGEVEQNPQTGQLTTTFTDSPQVPFEDFKLDFFEGPRAALATPEACGTYAASATLSPWSATAPVSPAIEAFPINAGCASGFSPSFSAGSDSVQAGVYAPLTLTFARADTDQELAGVSVSLPPGLLAKVAGVPECPESALAAAAAQSGAAEAAQPSCPQASQVGTVQASAGAGPDPFLESGKAYLTGPYKGGPYGIAVVVPALAGPFDLGTIVVRSALHIDPADAHVTAVSDPFPTIVKGIPLKVRSVTLRVDRPGFTFNPTDCNPLAAGATLTSTAGASAPVSARFQVGGCQNLPFKPKLTAATKGQASKAAGANFDVTVRSGGVGPAGVAQAGIAKVRLQLPRALPARLTTLQKACTERAFATNPASCPQASVIGTATIHTPVLASPLTGPAYLVSHGGAAFPDVEFVLQGENITLVLDGKTQIKNQITYSKFESAPDAPFTTFETVLPAGPHSALTTNLPEKAHFNLCKSSLSMPTEIVAQNGAVIRQNTKIALQGCNRVGAVRPHRLTRKQRLRRALAACRHHHNGSRARRAGCERRARTAYTANKGRFAHRR
jgi:hypothetical protein